MAVTAAGLQGVPLYLPFISPISPLYLRYISLTRYKHKGISLCMLLLTRALSGNYVNFGVFALYGDRALSDCLQVTINLCLCISLDEIMSYPKVSKCYLTLDHELTPTLTLTLTLTPTVTVTVTLTLTLTLTLT